AEDRERDVEVPQLRPQVAVGDQGDPEGPQPELQHEARRARPAGEHGAGRSRLSMNRWPGPHPAAFGSAATRNQERRIRNEESHAPSQASHKAEPEVRSPASIDPEPERRADHARAYSHDGDEGQGPASDRGAAGDPGQE